MITQQQTLATWLEEVPEALILASPHGEIIHANLRAQTTLSIDIVKHPLLSDLFDVINPETDNITRLLIRLRPSEEKRTMVRYKPEPFRAFNIAIRRSNQSDYVILSLREEVDVLEKFSSIKHELETYRLLTHNLPGSAVILFDRDMRYLVCDGPALSEAGYKNEDFLGKTLHEAIPQAADTLEPIYQRALDGEAHEAIIHGQRGGMYKSAVVPLINEDGHVQGGMLFIIEVTEHYKSINTMELQAQNQNTYVHYIQTIQTLLAREPFPAQAVQHALTLPVIPTEPARTINLNNQLILATKNRLPRIHISYAQDVPPTIKVVTYRAVLQQLFQMLLSCMHSYLKLPEHQSIPLEVSVDLDIINLTFTIPTTDQSHWLVISSTPEHLAHAIYRSDPIATRLMQLQLTAAAHNYTLTIHPSKLILSFQSHEVVNLSQ